MDKKIICLFLFFVVILPTGCLNNQEHIYYDEYEIVSIEQYNKLLYHIYYIENDCIEYVETDNLKDNIFFSFKINNETGYKLYSEKNMLIGGRYILYIPENDIIE